MSPQVYRIDGNEIVLLASRNRNDGLAVFPRIPHDSPAALLYSDVELNGTASLYSFTVIHPNPKSGQSPFVLALVDFPQQARVFGRLLARPGSFSIGAAVKATPVDGPEGPTYAFTISGEN